MGRQNLVSRKVVRFFAKTLEERPEDVSFFLSGLYPLFPPYRRTTVRMLLEAHQFPGPLGLCALGSTLVMPFNYLIQILRRPGVIGSIPATS